MDEYSDKNRGSEDDNDGFGDAFDGEFGDDGHSDETPDERLARLRKESKDGPSELLPELAEELMRHAQQALIEKRSNDAERFVDEAVEVAQRLVDSGEIEFLAAAARCMLFKAALSREHQDAENTLNLLNDLIRFLTEHIEEGSVIGRNELAVALMNKAEVLLDPIGAQSAAIATQQQAVHIWRRLVESDGMVEFCSQYFAALMALGDSKFDSGDAMAALEDYETANRSIHEALEEADTEGLEPFEVQAHLKLSKLYEKLGDFPAAFEHSNEAVQRLESDVAGGNERVEPALSALYMQRGMLFEQAGNTAAALTDFDRACDVYRRMLDRETEEIDPGPASTDYYVRTSLANALMCRANMLADLKRFDEAEQAFTESVDWYEKSGPLRPAENEDETFIPYSIGVVQLNHANMLVVQNRLDEAVGIKDKAIAALKRRYSAGHREILPNVVSAYRKLIGIRRLRNENDKAFESFDEILAMLDAVVDDGDLEYRTDIALMLHLRAACRDELGLHDGAEKDLLRALRIFRELADEETDSSKNQWAKLQWGELLQQIGLFYVRQNRVDDAWRLFQTEINDLFSSFAEGNEQVFFDVLFGQSQFVEFAGGFLREEFENHLREDVERWSRDALETARSGIKLIRQHRLEFPDDVSLGLFFRMKIAYFKRFIGLFLAGLSEYEQSYKTFGEAIAEWESLIADTDRLLLERKYYERESLAQAESEAAGEDGHENIEAAPEFSSRKNDSDSLSQKRHYYAGELRQTLQNAALAYMFGGQADRGKQLLRELVEQAREMLEQDRPDATQTLVVALMTYGRALEATDESEDALPLYVEALEHLERRLQNEVRISADYTMFRHVSLVYANLRAKLGQNDQAVESVRHYATTLRKGPYYPDPELWVDLCQTLNLMQPWITDSQHAAEEIDREKLDLIAVHPERETSPILQRYEQAVRNGETRPREEKDDQPV